MAQAEEYIVSFGILNDSHTFTYIGTLRGAMMAATRAAISMYGRLAIDPHPLDVEGVTRMVWRVGPIKEGVGDPTWEYTN